MQTNRNVIIAVGVLLTAILMVVGYLFLQNGSVDRSSTQSDSATNQMGSSSEVVNEEDVSNASETKITFTDDGFSPQQYTARMGQTISVTNKSDSDLQVSSDDHPSHLNQPELNLGILSSGESLSFTVTKPGTWGFHDHLHDQFTGTLKVTE